MRSYSDAVKWVRSAAPRRKSGRVAERAFAATFTAAIPFMAIVALVSPGSFGLPRANTFKSGWPLYVLLGIIGISIVYAATHVGRIRRFIARVREPFVRPYTGDPRFEGAADALAASSPALQTRFGIARVWGPGVVAVIAGLLCFSSAYFVVDAILARFNVGWEHPVLSAVNAVLAYVVFRLVAQRLLTWRLAVSVHKAVTTGYES